MELLRGLKKRAGLIVTAMAVTAVPVLAQDYPSQPITMVIGYAAGGGTDAALRAIAEPLAQELGQRILIQNVGGAGGGVAAVRVAKAAPDGYTILATTSSTFSLEPQVQRTAYSDDDFTHIATVGQFQGAIFAPASAPFNSYKEMVEFAKESGRSLKHATYFQLDKLLMQYIAKKEGIEIDFVPVNGGNGTVQAILSNAVDTGYSGGSWKPHTESGQAKPLFATSYERLKLAPDLPAMKDLGYEIGTTNYITISGPKGIPQEVVNKISTALSKVMGQENLQKMGEQRQMEIKYWGPEETRDILDFELRSFKEMVESAQ